MKKKLKVFFLIIFILVLNLFIFSRYFFTLPGKGESQFFSGKIKKTVQKVKTPLSEEKTPIKILFVGDLMFDRLIREYASQKGNGYIFEKIKNLLFESDLVVANLEGPITNNVSRSQGTKVGEKNHLIFTFDSTLTRTLYEENIKLVNLGNNHILNFGPAGVSQTKNFLKEAGVKYIGFTGEVSGEEGYVENINETKIGFINYNEFVNGGREQVFNDLKKIKSTCDFLVVYTHWGAEYATSSNASQRDLAHKLIDQGADLVIGTHPHVVEEKEVYQGKTIYYSLGNFVFDQYFSKETEHGLGVLLRLSNKKEARYEEWPLILERNGQTRPEHEGR